jgi:hypothetical protein
MRYAIVTFPLLVIASIAYTHFKRSTELGKEED